MIVDVQVEKPRAFCPRRSHDGDVGWDVKIPDWSSFDEIDEDTELLPEQDFSEPGQNYVFSDEIFEKFVGDVEYDEPFEALDVYDRMYMDRNGLAFTRLSEDEFGERDVHGVVVPASTGLKVSLGISLGIPDPLFVEVHDRSSTPIRRGLQSVGRVVDSGYGGEIHLMLWNNSPASKLIESGDRLAQLVPKIRPEVLRSQDGDLNQEIHFSDLKSNSGRGSSGLGSTGDS